MNSIKGKDMTEKFEELDDGAVRDETTHDGKKKDKSRNKMECSGKPLSASIGDILKSKKNG